MCIFKDYTGRRAKERWKVKDCKLRNQLGGRCSNWGGLPWPTLCSWQWQKWELTGFKDDLERQLTGPSDWLDRTEDRLLKNVKRKEVSKAALELLPWAAVEKAEPITESEKQVYERSEVQFWTMQQMIFAKDGHNNSSHLTCSFYSVTLTIFFWKK